MPLTPSPDATLPSDLPVEKKGAAALARNLVPWLVALTALGWVSHGVLGAPSLSGVFPWLHLQPDADKWAKLHQAFADAPIGLFVVVSTVFLVLNCAADTLAMYYTFNWLGGWLGGRGDGKRTDQPLPYRELFVVRAATYLLAVVQYYVGQAAILGFLHRRRGVPFLRATGWILFISGINMGVLVLIAALGLGGGAASVGWLRYVPLAIGAGALGYAALLRLRPAVLSSVRLLQPLFEMGVAGHLKATAVRLPHVLVLITWHFVVLRMFGVQVPPVEALVLLPAVFFAAALPVSVQGLGLSQAAAVYFFARYSPTGPAPVLAYSLAITTVSLVVQVALGLLFLPAGRRLGLGSEAPTPLTVMGAGDA